MEVPAWFQRVMQHRLDYVSARIERDPELRPFRAEEERAFEAMFPGVDKMQLPGFTMWEDRHHFRRALENERLYVQGMKDGVQLIMALLAGSAAFDDEMEAGAEEGLDGTDF